MRSTALANSACCRIDPGRHVCWQSLRSGDALRPVRVDAEIMPQGSDHDQHGEREVQLFEVCLRGVLSEGVIAELGAQRISSNTTVVFRATDRSELHGFIRRVEDLGLELVSVVEQPTL
jgi:hypothetical protein